ncbi:MAG: peptide deformylase, partial [Rhodospirillales bacterium]|nr:peptide deformylase [Rhodospirillales bacterium]
DETATQEEGCLSIPDQYAEVTRPARVKVRYHDVAGIKQEIEAEGLLAACLQHEIDHLNGVLFVDYLSALKRNMLLRKLAKAQKR